MSNNVFPTVALCILPLIFTVFCRYYIEKPVRQWTLFSIVLTCIVGAVLPNTPHIFASIFFLCSYITAMASIPVSFHIGDGDAVLPIKAKRKRQENTTLEPIVRCKFRLYAGNRMMTIFSRSSFIDALVFRGNEPEYMRHHNEWFFVKSLDFELEPMGKSDLSSLLEKVYQKELY